MNIQVAKTTDLPDILALLKAAALPVAGIENHIETVLVARDSERLFGCAAVEVYGQAGLLRSVAVEAARRGEQSEELRGACPASALAMRASLST